MKIQVKFNNQDFTIRQNVNGLYSLTDIEKAWEQSGGTGGKLQSWLESPEVIEKLESRKINVLTNHGYTGEDWGCEGAAGAFTVFCDRYGQFFFTTVTKLQDGKWIDITSTR